MDLEYVIIIKMVVGVLSADLLKKDLADKRIDHPLYGHCYVASEALYHILGGKASGWSPSRAKDATGTTHWWLENTGGEILDPTAGQYLDSGLTPPYEHGKRGGFLTGDKPSKRSSVVMDRVCRKYLINISSIRFCSGAELEGIYKGSN